MARKDKTRRPLPPRRPTSGPRGCNECGAASYAPHTFTCPRVDGD